MAKITQVMVKNFYSIKDELVIDFTKNNGDVLNTLYLFGKNNSGKTNILRIINEISNVLSKKVDFNLVKFNEYNNAKKDSEFEFEITIDNKIYRYGSIINIFKSKIIEEWLFVTDLSLQRKKEKKIFLRKNKSWTPSETEKNLYKKQINEFLNREDDEGFILYSLSQLGNEHARKLVKVFADTKYINGYDIEELNYKSLDVVIDNKDNLDKINALMKQADLSVSEVSFLKKEISFENDVTLFGDLMKDYKLEIQNIEDKINEPVEIGLDDLTELNMFEFFLSIMNERKILISNNAKPVVKTKTHEYFISFKNKDGVVFDWSEQSIGTRKIIITILSLFEIQSGDGFLLLDEADSSLNIGLIGFIFENYINNVENNSILCTLHNAILLDGNFIDRDQIIFVEREGKEGTTVEYLSNYKLRKEANIFGKYYSGALGGINQIKL